MDRVRGDEAVESIAVLVEVFEQIAALPLDGTADLRGRDLEHRRRNIYRDDAVRRRQQPSEIAGAGAEFEYVVVRVDARAAHDPR